MNKKTKASSLKFGTLAVHAGQSPDPTTGAIMMPIYQNSTYAQSSPGVIKNGYDYGRTANPTRTALEANLAELEGGKFGICFASGCAAMAAVLHLLKTGDHVLVCDDIYGGSFRLLDKIYKPLGIDYSVVDMTDAKAFAAGFKKSTRLVWVETPTNPMLKIIDLKLAAKLAKEHAALLAVDNTFATPFLQKPLTWGADIVSHSTTKYLGGHSDLIGGALIVNDSELAQRLHYIQNAVGAVPAPLDCFLTLRSTKTLHLRMQRHCENARVIAKALLAHPAVKKVIYPGHPDHPQHHLAKNQMNDFGGMISIELKGGLAAAKKMLSQVKIFSLAESLGGVESLIEHPAIMTHATIPPAQRAKLGISDGLVRISVGVEAAEDLMTDLHQAL